MYTEVREPESNKTIHTLIGARPQGHLVCAYADILAVAGVLDSGGLVTLVSCLFVVRSRP